MYCPRQFKSTSVYNSAEVSSEPDNFSSTEFPLGYVVSMTSRSVGVARSLQPFRTYADTSSIVSRVNGDTKVSSSFEGVIDLSNDVDDDAIESNHSLITKY
jgi:hypothetical protein